MFRLPAADLTMVLLANANLDDDTLDALLEPAVQVATGGTLGR